MQEAKIIRIIRCVTAVICVVTICIAVFKITDAKYNNTPAGGEVPTAEKTSVVEVTDKSGEVVTDASGEAVTSQVSVTENASTTAKNGQTTKAQATTKGNATTKSQGTTSGLTSTNISEVLKFYKTVAAKNAGVSCKKYLSLTKLDGGSGFAGSAINTFEGIARSALEKNSGIAVAFPGKPNNITASDWVAASAVSDGTFTTINIKVKTQTDGYNGKEFEGSVGRSMQVLPGVQTAINEMAGVSADFTSSNMKIEYQNPLIKLKVNNATMKLVPGSCEWKYNTHIAITYLKAKITIIPVTLQGTSGDVEYKVTY